MVLWCTRLNHRASSNPPMDGRKKALAEGFGDSIQAATVSTHKNAAVPQARSNAYIKADCITLGIACSTKKERVLYLVENNALFQKYIWYFGGNLTTKTGGLSGQWCQSFCNWVMTSTALTTNDAPLSESTAKDAKDEFAKSSTSFTFITSNPQPGDVIYYKWAGSGNTVDHAGLICRVIRIMAGTVLSYPRAFRRSDYPCFPLFTRLLSYPQQISRRQRRQIAGTV